MHINVRCVGEPIGTPPQVLKPLVLSHQWPFSALGIPRLSLPELLPIHSQVGGARSPAYLSGTARSGKQSQSRNS